MGRWELGARDWDAVGSRRKTIQIDAVYSRTVDLASAAFRAWNVSRLGLPLTTPFRSAYQNLGNDTRKGHLRRSLLDFPVIILERLICLNTHGIPGHIQTSQ